jgi:hypothetical protein
LSWELPFFFFGLELRRKSRKTIEGRGMREIKLKFILVALGACERK